MGPTPRLYLDNAATSSPKPPAVLAAMVQYATDLGGSPGRGAYRESKEAGRLLRQARQRIINLIHGEPRPDQVIFTLNCSDALNMGIKGVLRPGDHAITTELDHNSILRPFNKLAADGVITQTRVKCDPTSGMVDPEDIRRAIKPNTRLIALLHSSNVTGTIQPIAAIGKVAREHGVIYLVDGAQSLGHVPLDVQAANIDLLAAPGHKGLLGPLGTGFLYIRPGVESQMTTTREGGTGSLSEFDVQPDFMPDRFEPGSHNTIGILGLSEGVQFLIDRGLENCRRHEQQLNAAFVSTLDAADAPGLRVYGPTNPLDRTGVFSLRHDAFANPQHFSDVLERDFGLLTRSGLHCAPGAHRTIGTLHQGGTTRLSFGAFVTVEDVRYAAESVAAICQRQTTAKV
jgi:cysteine desulfurase/selenocysteine lyase